MNPVTSQSFFPAGYRVSLDAPQPLLRSEITDVQAIERESFGAGAWTRVKFFDEYQRQGVVARVIRVANKPAGYLLFEIHVDSFRVLRFATASWAREQGVARALLTSVTRLLTAQRNRVRMVVPETQVYQTPGLAKTLRSAGFIADGIFHDDPCDLIVFVARKSLSNPETKEPAREG